MCNDSSRNRVHTAFLSYLLADQLAGRATSNNWHFSPEKRLPPLFPLAPIFYVCVCVCVVYVCVCVYVPKVPSRFFVSRHSEHKQV